MRDPLCVIPACCAHHCAYHRGELDLLPYLDSAWRAQLAHATPLVKPGLSVRSVVFPVARTPTLAAIGFDEAVDLPVAALHVCADFLFCLGS